jgi:hypothetical protein
MMIMMLGMSFVTSLPLLVINDEFHKEQPRACLAITNDFFQFFHGI